MIYFFRSAYPVQNGIPSGNIWEWESSKVKNGENFGWNFGIFHEHSSKRAMVHLMNIHTEIAFWSFRLAFSRHFSSGTRDGGGKNSSRFFTMFGAALEIWLFKCRHHELDEFFYAYVQFASGEVQESLSRLCAKKCFDDVWRTENEILKSHR